MKVEVENLSILFKIKDLDSSFLRKDLIKKIFKKKPEVNNLWALKNINFHLVTGDRMGVIGTNGSGKSTLIKALCGILKPVEGSKIKIEGSFIPIVEPWGLAEVTDSLENNILLIGLLLGFKRKDIENNFNKIIEFSELNDKKKYQFSSLSTGMKLRIISAIVIIMDSQIFLIDEFLSTGDENFRNKVFKNLKEKTEKNISVICSHERGVIRQFCNKVLLLNKGEQVFFGDVEEGFHIYEDILKNNNKI